MAIVGLGNDLVQIARIERLLTGPTQQRFIRRVLTEQEQQLFAKQKQPARYLAKRWAAKEAAAKALGTGIARGVSFQDFLITNDELGKPCLSLLGVAQQMAGELGVSASWLSLSDEQDYAFATVVLES